MLSSIDVKLDQTERKIGRNTESFRQLERVALRYIILARRIGLPEDVEKAMDTIARFIIAVRQMEISIRLAQVALAGAGPIGWIALGGSAAFTALSFYSISGSN